MRLNCMTDCFIDRKANLLIYSTLIKIFRCAFIFVGVNVLGKPNWETLLEKYIVRTRGIDLFGGKNLLSLLHSKLVQWLFCLPSNYFSVMTFLNKLWKNSSFTFHFFLVPQAVLHHSCLSCSFWLDMSKFTKSPGTVVLLRMWLLWQFTVCQMLIIMQNQ